MTKTMKIAIVVDLALIALIIFTACKITIAANLLTTLIPVLAIAITASLALVICIHISGIPFKTTKMPKWLIRLSRGTHVSGTIVTAALGMTFVSICWLWAIICGLIIAYILKIENDSKL